MSSNADASRSGKSTKGARNPSIRKSFMAARSSLVPSMIDPLVLPDTLLDDEELSWWAKAYLLATGQVGVFLTLWIVWLLTGTLFYSEYMGLGFGKGFYMAVNTGYSIGWGDIVEDKLSFHWFSLFYVLAGASFVGAALGFFADSIVSNCNNWYVKAQLEDEFNRNYASSTSLLQKVYLWCCYHWDKLKAIALWCSFVFAASIGACICQDWPFITGVYFAVSSMSTGGLVALEPDKTTDSQYFLTGVFAGLGVPLMGVAMATLAGFFINTGDIESTMEQIREDVTAEEVEMLIDMGLADNDGVIDRTEFIILCMVRTGAADPLLIKLIKEYFDLMDEDQSGGLDLEEITRHAKDVLKDGKAKQTAKVLESSVPMSKRRMSVKNILDHNEISKSNAFEKKAHAVVLAQLFTASASKTASMAAHDDSYTRLSVSKVHKNDESLHSDHENSVDEESGLTWKHRGDTDSDGGKGVELADVVLKDGQVQENSHVEPRFDI